MAVRQRLRAVASSIASWGPAQRLLAVPAVAALAGRLYRALGGAPEPARASFQGSQAYWVERYRRGGDSGAGSAGDLAQFKADVINEFVVTHEVRDVLELGCGDGRQLALAHYPRYLGIDVSPDAVARCRERFADDPTKTFLVLDDHDAQTAELALSLDVIYHLVEDEVYEDYMARLFGAATRYVIVYSSDRDEQMAAHVRQRAFTPWVAANAPQWRLDRRLPNPAPYDPATGLGSISDFWFYSRV